MVGFNRNRGTDGSDGDFWEPEGTGTDILTKLEPVQEPEPSLRTAVTRKRPFLRNFKEKRDFFFIFQYLYFTID